MSFLLKHDFNHPNGFKVLLASKIFKKQLVTSTCKDIRLGAQLIVECENGTDIQYDPNTAIALLGQCHLGQIQLQWLQWEAHLQGTVFPYVRSILAKKEEKSLVDPICSHLSLLEAALASEPNYFDQNLSVIDIALYGSLSLLIKSKSFSATLKACPKVTSYLKFLKNVPEFAECEKEFYQLDSSKPGLWVERSSTPISTPKATWDLLKSTKQPVVSKPEEEEKKIFSKTDMAIAKEIWSKGYVMESRDQKDVILPVEGENNTLITSALPYVNNVPHLGNIIGCVLSADVFARFCRLRGDNVLYICGTDEYGTATETKALAEGLTPRQICDKYNAIHASVYEWFNIEFDHFGRTTGPHQQEVAHQVFWNIHKNGNISQSSVEQLYCTQCQKFLADRFVEGVCPHPGCLYEDARGDQCDKCGKLVNAVELKNPKCNMCFSKPEIRSSSHLFLDLPNVQHKLKKWINETSDKWTTNAKGIAESWLRDGLKERCITRDLKWGTKVPLEGYTDKVFYVWFDAPLGYVSMTKEYTEQWELWWKNPQNVSYYEFMAKDNVPFHSIVFPACQIATGENWTKVTHLMATEYLNYEDGKFSKSRQQGVFGDQAKSTGIPSDVWRFYLLYIRPESQDTSFSWVDLQTKNNSELLNNLGNFINRALKFTESAFKSVMPAAHITESDLQTMAAVNAEVEAYKTSLGLCKLREGIRNILSISRIGNHYIQDNAPFKLVTANSSEEDKRRGGTVIHIAVNMVGLLAVLLQPYMPETAKTILSFLNISKEIQRLPVGFSQMIPAGHKLDKSHPLIEKISDEFIKKMQKDFTASPAVAPQKPTLTLSMEELETQVTAQGNEVRKLKSEGAPKDKISAAVGELLRLKKALAISQGVDPATLVNDKKKKKNK